MSLSPGGLAAETSIVDFSALVLDTLGFTADEFVSIGYEDAAGRFHTAVMSPTDAIGCVSQLPTDANIYFGVNAITGPVRANAGRGTETDVTRLAGLWCELDVKPGGCQSLDVARAIIANLSIVLGARPSVTVESGHGLHAYWSVSDGHTNGDITAARALVHRFGRLVGVVAETLGVKVDNVYDLARMLRVPGTFNNKNLNGQGPIPVIAHAEGGGPLTVAEVDERLTEVGIDQQDEDHQAAGVEVSAPVACGVGRADLRLRDDDDRALVG